MSAESNKPWTTTIWAVIRTQFEHLHCYPDAPEAVKFLRDMHRHIFHVVVHIEQFHTDRDVEYVLFKRWLDARITHHKEMWSQSSSCEAMAMRIGQLIQLTYCQDASRKLRIEVNEDGENGALVEF